MKRPTVYIPETNGHRQVRRIRALGWGRMWTTKHIQRTDPAEPAGFDNGAWGAYLRGETFPVDRFLQRVETSVARGVRPNLAVLPDIVAGGRRSLELSASWFRYGNLPPWPWYLAVQNGIRPEDFLLYPWEGLAGIFLGGDDSYKSTALEWRKWSRKRGLLFHYGRASSRSRVLAAIHIEADSLDSLYLHPAFWNLPDEPGRRYCRDLLTGEQDPPPRLDIYRED